MQVSRRKGAAVGGREGRRSLARKVVSYVESGGEEENYSEASVGEESEEVESEVSFGNASDEDFNQDSDDEEIKPKKTRGVGRPRKGMEVNKTRRRRKMEVEDFDEESSDGVDYEKKDLGIIANSKKDASRYISMPPVVQGNLFPLTLESYKLDEAKLSLDIQPDAVDMGIASGSVLTPDDVRTLLSLPPVESYTRSGSLDLPPVRTFGTMKAERSNGMTSLPSLDRFESVQSARNSLSGSAEADYRGITVPAIEVAPVDTYDVSPTYAVAPSTLPGYQPAATYYPPFYDPNPYTVQESLYYPQQAQYQAAPYRSTANQYRPQAPVDRYNIQQQQQQQQRRDSYNTTSNQYVPSQPQRPVLPGTAAIQGRPGPPGQAGQPVQTGQPGQYPSQYYPGYYPSYQ